MAAEHQTSEDALSLMRVLTAAANEENRLRGHSDRWASCVWTFWLVALAEIYGDGRTWKRATRTVFAHIAVLDDVYAYAISDAVILEGGAPN